MYFMGINPDIRSSILIQQVMRMTWSMKKRKTGKMKTRLWKMGHSPGNRAVSLLICGLFWR